MEIIITMDLTHHIDQLDIHIIIRLVVIMSQLKLMQTLQWVQVITL